MCVCVGPTGRGGLSGGLVGGWWSDGGRLEAWGLEGLDGAWHGPNRQGVPDRIGKGLARMRQCMQRRNLGRAALPLSPHQPLTSPLNPSHPHPHPPPTLTPQFLKDPGTFSKLGARPPKGILLEGDPGGWGGGGQQGAVLGRKMRRGGAGCGGEGEEERGSGRRSKGWDVSTAC